MMFIRDLFILVTLSWITKLSRQQDTSYMEQAMQTPKCKLNGEDYCNMADLYIQTVMKSVSGVLLQTPSYKAGSYQIKDAARIEFNPTRRKMGSDWPVYGVTMAGQTRLLNVYTELLRITSQNIEGDFLEAGVWRGGSSIVAKAVLKVFDDKHRNVHIVDSFQGLPAPRKHFKNVESDHFSKMTYLQVSLQQVKSNFERYNLLGENVQFHKGFFNESLAQFRKENPSAKIAFLRLDGDMYESTTDILYNVYDFVPVGGAVVVDDWNVASARRAFQDFFEHHKVDMEEMIKIDDSSQYMIKKQDFVVDYQYYMDTFVSKK